MIWINTYLPAENVQVEILTKEDVKEKACITFVYDSDCDPNSNTPKWWCEKLSEEIELRDVIAWRYVIES